MASLTTSCHDLHKQSNGGVLKKVFLKVLWNSQGNCCAEISFLCTFNKKRGSGTDGFLWIWQNWFDVKIQKANVCKCFLKKYMKVYIYMFCVYINETKKNRKKRLYYKCCSRFIMWLKIKNIITQILVIRHLIKSVWIIVFASQVWQEMFVLGLGCHQS